MLSRIPNVMQLCVATHHKRYFFLLSLLSLSGCATFSQDGGFNAVQKTTQQYIQQTPVGQILRRSKTPTQRKWKLCSKHHSVRKMLSK